MDWKDGTYASIVRRPRADHFPFVVRTKADAVDNACFITLADEEIGQPMMVREPVGPPVLDECGPLPATPIDPAPRQENPGPPHGLIGVVDLHQTRGRQR